MSTWWRLPTLLLPVLVVAPAVLFGALLRLLGARAPGARLAVRAQRWWARRSLSLLRVRLDVEAPLPAGTFLIAANHLSWLDVPVLAALFPARFVAKSEIARWPGVGLVCRLANTLFVRRGDRRDVPRVGAEMRATLAAGIDVSFFPEGWASRGLGVRRFHPGLFQAAVDAGVPCLPVSIDYTTPCSPYAPAWTVAWWGAVPLWQHARRMLREGPVVARVRWPAAALVGVDRKQLAGDLEAAVRASFRPLGQAPLPPHLPGDPSPDEGLPMGAAGDEPEPWHPAG